MILNILKSLIIILIFLLIWAFVFFQIFFSVFQISGNSMLDSFYHNEVLLVDKFSYKFNDYNRGDVVVANTWDSDHSEYFLKRIIWIPWDTLKINWWDVFIKNDSNKDFIKLEENYLNEANNHFTFILWNRNRSKEYVYEIPEWSYFLMWDNRNNSLDSRNCFWTNCYAASKIQFISKNDITGKVLYSLWYHTSIDFYNFWYSSFEWVLEPRWKNILSSWEYKELN